MLTEKEYSYKHVYLQEEGHVHKYEAVFGSFVDIGIVATVLSFA